MRRFFQLQRGKDVRSGGWVIVGIFVRAILDFAGLAALMAVLLLLLDEEAYRPYLWLAAFGGVVFMMLKNLITIWLDRCQCRYLLSLYRILSTQLLERYYRRGLLFIREESEHALTYNVNQVCYTLAFQVMAPLMRVVGEGVVLLLIIVSLFIYFPEVVLLLAACCIPICWGYIRLTRGRVEHYGKQENQAKQDQWQVVRELFRGYAEIEVNQAYDLFLRRFNEGVREISYNRVRLETIQRLPAAFIETGIAFGILMLVLATGVGDDLKVLLAVFGVAAFRILPGLRALLDRETQIRNNFFAVSTLKEAFCDEEETEVGSSVPITFENKLKADDLLFTYDMRDNLVINGFSFSLQPGERVGIKGISGAGKSTLFNLLLGFFPLVSGEIRIDGVLLTSANRSTWLRLVGYVPQEVFIVDGTIAENVAFGELEEVVDYERIATVLEQVRLADWAKRQPDGLDTSLGEYGCRLSVGQRQRIGIARALYKDATVLFLDEATSALDRKTEKDIMEVIRQLADSNPRLTLLMISHREAPLQICNRVIDL